MYILIYVVTENIIVINLSEVKKTTIAKVKKNLSETYFLLKKENEFEKNRMFLTFKCDNLKYVGFFRLLISCFDGSMVCIYCKSIMVFVKNNVSSHN